MSRCPGIRFGLVLALWLCASSVLAQTKVVVRKFDEPKSAKIREALVDALQGEVELVESGKAEAAGDLSTEEGRVSAARELEVSAFIEGSVDKGRNWTLTLTVYNGADGASLGETEIKGSATALPGKVKRNGWDAVGPLVAQGAVPAAAAAAAAVEPEPEAEPEPEPEQEAEPEEEEEEKEEEEPESDSDSDLHALDFSVGLRLQTRDLSYKDAFPGLRDYELGLSPNLYLEGHWYPGAHVSNGVAAWFGLELRGQFMLGVDSENTAGESFPTSSNAFGVGLRFRVPLGSHEIALLAGYGTHSFAIDPSDGGVDPEIPDVAYGFVRLGADARLELGSLLRLEVRVAYLPLLSLGGISERNWFPNASGSGVEADLTLGIAVVEWLELNVGGGLVRYGMSFDPKPTDAGVVNFGRVAGGALDQYYSLRFGATLRL